MESISTYLQLERWHLAIPYYGVLIGCADLFGISALLGSIQEASYSLVRDSSDLILLGGCIVNRSTLDP